MKNFRDLYNQNLSFFIRNVKVYFDLCLIFLLFFIIIDVFYWDNYEFRQQLLLYSSGSYYILNNIVVCLCIFTGMIFVMIFVLAIDILEHKKALSVNIIIQTLKSKFIPFCYVNILIIIRTFLWGLILVLPGLVKLIYYSLAGYACLVDGVEGVQALRLSKALIKPELVRYTDHLLLSVLSITGVFLPIIFLLNFFENFCNDRLIYFLADITSYLQWYIILLGIALVITFNYYLFKSLKERVNRDHE